MSEIEYGIDVSSHQPRDLTAIIQQHKPSHVIVKGYLTAESISQDHSREQVRSAWANGCSAGMYVWCYSSVDPARTIDDMIDLCASIGLVLPILWLDCEIYKSPGQGGYDPGPDASWLREAIERAAQYEMPVGIYTGKWWVQGYFPGGLNAYREFASLPQWISEYDGIADINRFTPFSGIERLAAKQWTTKLPGDTYELDRNVIWSDYTTVAPQPQPEPQPGDELARLRQQLEGMRILADDVAYERLGRNIEGMKVTRDVLMQAVKALDVDIAEAEATQTEVRRIRVEFMGQP